MLVETIFRYRTLAGRCDLGVGLDWDEIAELAELERIFAPTTGDRRKAARRQFRREHCGKPITATLRGLKMADPVEICDLSPGGVRLRGEPCVVRGEQVELAIECDHASYRFRAEGVWLRDDRDDYELGLAFRGAPVCVRKRPSQPALPIVRAA